MVSKVNRCNREEEEKQRAQIHRLVMIRGYKLSFVITTLLVRVLMSRRADKGDSAVMN